MKAFSFPTRKNTAIHCCQWLPDGKPIAILQLVHGISEYAARYDALARMFTARGFVVTAEDHMGHGASISADIPQGCLEGGWSAAVSDTYRLTKLTREEFPDLPYVLYGHSMGSFLVRTLLYTYPDADLRAVVLSGTGWEPKPVLQAGRAVCQAAARRVGWDHPSHTVDKLMFGSYNKGYPAPRTPMDWLTRDEAEVARYLRDPLLGASPSVRLAYEMLGGMLRNEDRKHLENMPKDLPVLFISGASDPVGGNGKGVRRTCAAFRAAGMRNVTCKLYPDARHELHNEYNREEVYADVLAFLARALGRDL